jgi:hypothetical protein
MPRVLRLSPVKGVPTYPTAMVLARAAYEGAIRVLWMLKPDNPFDRGKSMACECQADGEVS